MRLVSGAPRRPLVPLLAVLTALAGLVTGAPPASATSGIVISVGYADSLRANPANFPTPWAGDSGVTFEGCTGCTYDAGAVKVFNNTFADVTVDSVIVRFDTCLYDIWPHGVTLPAGGQLIVTQMTSGADNGCTPGNGHMDSSDIGAGGAPWAGRCDQSGVIPVVEVTIGGTPIVFHDNGQVLNTGGVDKADCGGGANESTQWTTGPCPPGAQLGLEPTNQEHHVGTTATVDATLTNECSPPEALPGVQVTFTVTAGPDAGLTGSGIADADGKVSWSYSSALTGTDTVEASVTNLVGTFRSDPAYVTWTNSPPVCTAATLGTATLWPPDHRLVPLTVTGVTDPDGDTVGVAITGVTQDEPLDGLGDGDTSPDAVLGPGATAVSLRAERSGTGDGRVYTVALRASDGFGGTCTGTIAVSVPHDQSGRAAVDSGQTVNSLG